MSNKEHIRRLDEKIEITRIRRRCGYLIVIALLIAVALLAGIWINCQLMHQIIYQQEDSLDQLMELRQELDEAGEAAGTEAVAEEVVDLGTFEITHYCTCERCCGEFADGRTATGTVATPGRTVAADPAVLPYGTVIVIDGREYIVEDCGGAIKGKHIDILAKDHETALRAGRYQTEVAIKKECQPVATADNLV